MSIVKNSVGRPKKSETKSDYCILRLTKEENDRLSSMSVETGLSKSQLLREGLKMRLNVHKYYKD